MRVGVNVCKRIITSVQQSAQIVAPAPSSSVDQAHQFIREAPNTTSMIRVPSGPGWKAESKLYPSSQSHRMQYLRGWVGVFFIEKQNFLRKKCAVKIDFRKLVRYSHF
jgi:hypothetical protein